MDNFNQIVEFQEKRIRRHYDEANDVWYFSLVDIVEALSDSKNPTDYLKKRRNNC